MPNKKYSNIFFRKSKIVASTHGSFLFFIGDMLHFLSSETQSVRSRGVFLFGGVFEIDLFLL